MTAQPHAVAALLTDEMKDRVRAATFERSEVGLCEVGNVLRCPLAVALDFDTSLLTPIGNALGDFDTVADFAAWADSSDSDPADVKALLGVSEDDQ